jgi:hypothetical protein
MLKLSRNGGKNPAVKINGKDIKEVDSYSNQTSLKVHITCTAWSFCQRNNFCNRVFEPAFTY